MSMFKKKIAWEKQGLIIEPRPQLWWNRTHTMCPTLDPLDGSMLRVIFAGRNDKNQSHVGWAIVDLDRDGAIVDFAAEPLLGPGDLGCFDDNGTVPNNLVQAGKNRKFLYYVGFKPGGTTRMDLFPGLAISEDNGQTFERYSRAPVMDRTRINPFINTAPFVLPGKDQWRMYYVAGTGWRHRDQPRYNLQYATSDDGIHWRRDGTVCIDYADESENALARPFVLYEDGVYKMWFSAKGAAYRLAYAESEDGIHWVRDDDYAGITPSESGWDSEMIEYAVVGHHKGRKYMLYNGNNYGFGGIGLAWEK